MWSRAGQLREGPGGVLPEDLGGGARRASGNPYPISDQNGQNLYPISDQKGSKTQIIQCKTLN